MPVMTETTETQQNETEDSGGDVSTDTTTVEQQQASTDTSGENDLPEGVRNTLKAQRDAEKAATREAKRLQKELDDVTARLKEREDAEKSELEKAQEAAQAAAARAEAAEARRREAAIRAAVAVEANKLNLHDADVAVRLLDGEAIEYDEDNEPTNIPGLLEALTKAHPYLVKAKGGNATVDPTPNGGTRTITDEDIRKRAGNRLAYPRL